MAGIYLHIPFCKQACYYCDFHFSTNRSQQQHMVQALASELMIQKNYLAGEAIDTIYFGGGTPSLLSSDDLRTIFESLRKNYTVAPSAEITLEANPDDLSIQQLGHFRESGINRLSIGIQSFQDSILRYMNRAHTGREAIRSVADARDAGINNISIDLIYAVPGLSESEWKNAVQQAIDLKPEHLSAYSLTIEPKTVFGVRASRKLLAAVDDDVSARHFEILVNELDAAGYEHYEVSNFCRPGYISRHNSSYWRQEKYLGIGPSAHSYNTTSRQFNIRNNNAYLKALDLGQVPFEMEMLTRNDKVNDYLLTTLRTSWGCDTEWLKKNLQYDLLKEHQKYLNDLLLHNLVYIEHPHLKLTRKGKMMADKIAADLFLVEE